MRRTLPFLIAISLLLGAATSAFSQSLAVYSGNGQVALEQFLTTEPMTAIALDAHGNPIAGLPIAWSITQGAGTIVNPAGVTDANGLATARFLGTAINFGSSYTQSIVTASSSAGAASFYVTTTVLRLPGGGTGALPLLELLSSRTLTGTAGSVLPGAVQVRMSVQSGPQAGQLLPNIGMRIYYYNDPSSTPAGACRGGTALTDATGVATCDLVLNSILGEGQLSAIAGEAEISPSFYVTITPGASCSYAINPPSQSFSGVGGTGSFTLSAASGCNWTAASNANWVVLTGPVAGSGNATIGFAVATNAGAARTANITVGSQVFTISQAAAGATTPLTVLTSAALPSGSVTSPYSIQLQAGGGTPPYRWNGVSLPNGLSLSSTGLLSGTPASAGTFTFIGAVTDAVGTSASQTFNLTISSAPSTTGPQITTTSFPSGTTGQAYKQAVAFTTSCTSPFSPAPVIALSSGTLPPGLTLSSPVQESWIVSGTPASAGTFTFGLTITEICGRTSSSSFTIVINGGGGGGGGQSGGAIFANPSSISFTIGAGTSLAPPSAVLNLTSSTGAPVSYNASIVTGTGGSWLSVIGGASGTTPTTLTVSLANFQSLPAGTYSAQIQLQSANVAVATIPVTLNVSSAPPVTVSPASLVFTTPVVFSPANYQQAVEVSSSTAQVPFTVGSSTVTHANWLGATPGSGKTPQQVVVVVNPYNLGPGTYTGAVEITPTGGVPVTIPVTLVVTTPPALAWSVPVVNSTYITGGPVPQPVTITLLSSSSSLQFQLPNPPASWLKVSPNIGTTPAQITLTFDPTGLAPGVYQAILTASAIGSAAAPASLQISFSVQQSSPTISAILNAASFLPAALAPGEEVQIVGSGLGPVAQADATADANGIFETTLAGASVYFNGFPAPVLHASDGQITVLVPYEIAGQQSANVVAEYLFAQSAPQNFVAADSNPGLFTVSGGQGIVFNADGSFNSLTNGASPGSIVGILGTGEGQTIPAGIDGLVMQADSLASPVLPVSVTINGEPAMVVSAASAPGQPAGVFLIQVQVPLDAPLSTVVPVSVTIGSATTQSGVTMVISSQ